MDYPYYIIPDIEALPEASGDERKKLIRRIYALVGDPAALREILGLDPEEFAAFYPDMLQPDLSTDDTIDSFLGKYGDPKAATSKEVKNIEELVPLPPLDYDLSEIPSDPILEEGQTSSGGDSTADLLNAFLDKEEKEVIENEEKTALEKEEKTEEQTPALSESLARAMIKNGNYRKALEIITDLSLKNPKKSIYFADQIRFLKKLILNQSKTSN